MKTCPHCTGEIPREAAKCKHCGEWIAPRPAAASKDGMQLIGEAAKTGVAAYIVLSILGVVVSLVFFLVFFLPQMNKMEKRHDEFQKNHDAFKKNFDQEWEKAKQEHQQNAPRGAFGQ